MKSARAFLQSVRGEIFRGGVLKNSVIISFSKLVSSLLNLGFMIYAVNLLSRGENGKLQYYLGFLPAFLAIAEFGLPSAMIKFISPFAERKEDPNHILAASIRIKAYSFLTLVCIGLSLYTGTGENYFTITVLLLGAFLISFISYFESIFIAYRSYQVMAFFAPLPNLVRLVFLFLLSESSEYPLTYLDVLVVFTLSPLFVLFFSFFFLGGQKISWSAPKIEVRFTEKKLLLFNLWALVASIFAVLSDRLEIFFLNKYHPSEVVAYYGTALQLFSGFLIILGTFNNIIYPKMARLADTKEFGPFLFRSIALGGGIALLLSPGYFLGEPVLDLLFGTKYVSSIPVFHLLYPNFLLQLVFAPLGTALFALGQPKILAFLAFLRFVFGCLFDTWIIPEWGARGAGVAFLLGQIIPWLVLSGYFLAYLRRSPLYGSEE